MKKLFKPNNLPPVMLGAGLIAAFLQWLIYLTALDEKGLIIPFHPVVLAQWLLSIGVLALVVSVVSTLDGVKDYAVNFPASARGALGQFVMAACVFLTVLLQTPAMGGTLGQMWRWLGTAAGLALVWTGIRRTQGKAPAFGFHVLICAYLALHVVTHYQIWSSTPQLQDYAFHLLGGMTLLFFSYYHMSFDVGLGKRRMLLIMGLMAIYLCTAALPDAEYKLIYAGGILWALTNLCAFHVPGEKVEK